MFFSAKCLLKQTREGARNAMQDVVLLGMWYYSRVIASQSRREQIAETAKLDAHTGWIAALHFELQLSLAI